MYVIFLKGTTIQQLIGIEEEFIKKKKFRQYERIKVGIPILREELSKVCINNKFEKKNNIV